MKRIIPLLLVAMIALSVPGRISFQGRLTDDLGVPMEGEIEVIFQIFDDLTGGIALWEETQFVEFNQGLFHVYLGASEPLDGSIFDGSVRYIAINASGDPLEPRIPLTSVPYAYRAETVPWDTLGAYLDTTFSGTVTHIDSITFVDSVSYIDSISFIEYITHIDSIRHIDSLRFIDSIRIIDYISYIDSITFIDSIGFIAHAVWADSAVYAGHVYWDSIRGIPDGLGGDVVTSLNTETGDLTIEGGDDITVSTDAGVITVDYTGDAGDDNWERVGDDLRNIPDGNVGIGALPPPADRLHVLGNGEESERAIVGLSSTGPEGWLGTQLYGAYGQFDSHNYGYLGASGYGVYAEGTSHAGYFVGDVSVTGDANIDGNINLQESSMLNIDGSSGDVGQVLSRSATGLAWTDAETAGLLWRLDGNTLYPRDITNHIRVANDSTNSFGFFANMKTGTSSGIGAAFSSSATTGSSIGLVGMATTSGTAEEAQTMGGQFMATAANQTTLGIEVTANITDASSDKAVFSAAVTAIQEGG